MKSLAIFSSHAPSAILTEVGTLTNKSRKLAFFFVSLMQSYQSKVMTSITGIYIEFDQTQD